MILELPLGTKQRLQNLHNKNDKNKTRKNNNFYEKPPQKNAQTTRSKQKMLKYGNFHASHTRAKYITRYKQTLTRN